MKTLKTLTTLVLAGGMAALWTGCASSNAAQHIASAYSEFINQQRVYEPVVYENVDEFIVRGKNMTVRMTAPLNPLSAMPQNPTVVDRVLNGAETMGRLGVMAYGINRYTQMPRVVNQQVVRPEIVEVEASE